jgi:hypothetical protein
MYLAGWQDWSKPKRPNISNPMLLTPQPVGM